MKKNVKDLSEKEIMHTLDALYTAAGAVRGRASMKLFLKDLLTESERIMLGRRILIARLLIQGETAEDIRTRTGAGFNTIERIRKWLKDQLPGYEVAIKGLENELGKRATQTQYASSAIARLKKKYPLHFLLFPTPKK